MHWFGSAFSTFSNVLLRNLNTVF